MKSTLASCGRHDVKTNVDVDTNVDADATLTFEGRCANKVNGFSIERVRNLEPKWLRKNAHAHASLFTYIDTTVERGIRR